MQRLDDRVRRRLLAFSAMLCAIPVLLTPLAGRSSFELASEQAAFNARFSAPQLPSAWKDSPIAVERDPFIAQTGNAADATSPRLDVIGMQVVQGQPMGYAAPANGVVSAVPVADVTYGVPAVRAIATGVSPHALIEENSHARIVGIGDIVAGSPIVAIAAGAIRLKNGAVFTLTQEHP